MRKLISRLRSWLFEKSLWESYNSLMAVAEGLLMSLITARHLLEADDPRCFLRLRRPFSTKSTRAFVKIWLIAWLVLVNILAMWLACTGQHVTLVISCVLLCCWRKDSPCSKPLKSLVRDTWWESILGSNYWLCQNNCLVSL